MEKLSVLSALLLFCVVLIVASGFAAMNDARACEKLDVVKKMERYSPTNIDFDDSILSEKDKKLLKKLVEASLMMDEAFLRQCYSKNVEMRDTLQKMDDPTHKELLHYFTINFGPFDRLDEREPFMGEEKRPGGANFYPEDMTKEEFDKWIKNHPKDAEKFKSLFTVIRRRGDGLVAVPYSREYAEFLKPAARLLREAAKLTDNPSLKKYLKSRAKAFLKDDYYKSDIDWIDLKDNLIEITIGPYEVYEDTLFGYKAAFESFVTINDPEESKNLEKLVRFLPEFEMNLPIPDEHKNKDRGAVSPIRVAIEVFSAGDTKAGVQTTAFNLPNDERVRKARGSKKVLLKNVSQAKFGKSLMPISKIVLGEDQRKYVNFNAYFNDVLQHELAHGLGPGFITLPDGTKTEVGQALKEQYSAIEEAKADIVGLLDTQYLIDKGEFPKELEKETYATFLAGIFRAIRFGIGEAHGRANILEFNYILEKGGIKHDPNSEKVGIDFGKIKESVRALANKLLMIQARGDYYGAKKLLEEYAVMTPEVEKMLEKLKGIPVDIEPIFTVEEKMKNW
ncbi:MAG: peptidase [Acidobacteriota bacterium]